MVRTLKNTLSGLLEMAYTDTLSSVEAHKVLVAWLVGTYIGLLKNEPFSVSKNPFLVCYRILFGCIYKPMMIL